MPFSISVQQAIDLLERINMPEEVLESITETETVEPVVETWVCDGCESINAEEEETPTDVNGNSWCETCISNYASWCESCDRYYVSEDGGFCEYHDEMYCPRCWRRHHDNCRDDDENSYDNDTGPIHPSDYKPDRIFHDIDRIGPYPGRVGDFEKLHMGFEIEVEYNGNSSSSMRETAYSIGQEKDGENESLFYCKHDGSVSCGFEIVSHPCTLEYYGKPDFPWKRISKLKSLGFESWNQSSCGLHIHMNKNAFTSDLHMWKFIYFIYRNKTPLVQFAGRESEQFASFSMDKFLAGRSGWDSNENEDTLVAAGQKLVWYAKKKGVNSERYCAVNLRNMETIELRFFKPSLNTRTVQGCIQFCAALFDYTAEQGDLDDDIEPTSAHTLNFPEFHRWAMVQNEKYPDMIATIAKRVGSARKDT